MIISSAPLRFSLNGGGSDLPSYFQRFSGSVVSIPLDKRVYVTLHESFTGQYRIAYSKIEYCSNYGQIQHPIVAACLQYVDWKGPGMEITSIADVPSSGTGLGSSSAFTVALLAGLLKLQNRQVSLSELAEMACEVEIRILQSPIGYQDQYASALGGLNVFYFSGESGVKYDSVFDSKELENQFVNRLNSELMFFHIDQPRSANEILARQQKSLSDQSSAVENTHKMVQLAAESVMAIQQLNIPLLGKLLTEGWKMKSTLNGDDADPVLKSLLQWANDGPIYGAKLLGAGGGGFLAVLASSQHHDEVRLQLKEFKEYHANTEIRGPLVEEHGRS